MDFALTNEQRMILSTVREFVTRELLPLEPEVQRAELEGRSFPEPTDVRRLQQKAKTAGLWGLLTPEEYGGVNLGMLMTALISAETSKALIPFTYGDTRTTSSMSATRSKNSATSSPPSKVNDPVALR